MYEEPKEKNVPIHETSSMIDSVTEQEERYKRKRDLAQLGLYVFLLGLGLFAISHFPPVGNATPPPPVSETSISNLHIAYYSPDALEVGAPATFRVFIYNSELLIGTPEVRQSLLSAPPIPNGTPNVPLSQAFGAGYDVFAYAQLEVSPSSKFDLPQLRQDSQSLEQAEPVFSWTITPQATTQAVITIMIIGQWKPKGAGNEIDIPLGEFHQSYVISTSESFIIQALIKLGNGLSFTFSIILPIISTIGGIGLTIPWIVDQIQKKRNKSKQTKRKSPQRRRKRG